jgi:nicotinamidase-related amidase/HPt (histidine-containing phosphotransfer) domain-containing protein
MPERTALVVIDVQQGFDDPRWGQRSTPHAEYNIAVLLEHFRRESLPIIHVQHCSLASNSTLREGTPGWSLKSQATPLAGEPLIKKNVNSCFIGTNLEGMLHAKGITTLVMVGLTTDHCVSTTARMAANLGFKVFLVSDATATFERRGANGEHFSAEVMHATALASLNGEFAMVLSTSDVMSRVPGDRVASNGDPALAELTQNFIASLDERERSLREAVEKQNFSEVRQHAHKLVGAGFFGFSKLSETASMLERAAIEQNIEQIRSWTPELHQLLEAAKATTRPLKGAMQEPS